MMNDLQIGLLAVGSVVVAGVFIFNRYQERKFRKQAEALIAPPQADVLLQPDAGVSGRFTSPVVRKAMEDSGISISASGPVEPVMGTLTATAEERPEPVIQPATPARTVSSKPVQAEAVAEQNQPAIEEALPGSIDPEIDYVSWILASQPIDAQDIKRRLRQQPIFNKPVLWVGMERDGHWREVMRADDDVAFSKLVGRVQLVDRFGPIAARDLTTFTKFVQDIAQSQRAICPDIDETRRQAVKLDQVCADVDVQVGLNIHASNDSGFEVARIRSLAESLEMKLSEDGTFHRVNRGGQIQFVLSNADGSAFDARSLKTARSMGVTFLLDVPRVEDGLAAFEDMVSAARFMANALECQLVDDNRRELTENGIQTIRRQLTSLYQKMMEVRIKPGSPSALRLFS